MTTVTQESNVPPGPLKKKTILDFKFLLQKYKAIVRLYKPNKTVEYYSEKAGRLRVSSVFNRRLSQKSS